MKTSHRTDNISTHVDGTFERKGIYTVVARVDVQVTVTLPLGFHSQGHELRKRVNNEHACADGQINVVRSSRDFFFFPTWPRHTEAVIFGRFLLKLCLNWVEAGAEEEDDEIFVLVFSRFRFCSRLDSPF